MGRLAREGTSPPPRVPALSIIPGSSSRSGRQREIALDDASWDAAERKLALPPALPRFGPRFPTPRRSRCREGTGAACARERYLRAPPRSQARTKRRPRHGGQSGAADRVREGILLNEERWSLGRPHRAGRDVHRRDAWLRKRDDRAGEPACPTECTCAVMGVATSPSTPRRSSRPRRLGRARVRCGGSQQEAGPVAARRRTAAAGVRRR